MVIFFHFSQNLVLLAPALVMVLGILQILAKLAHLPFLMLELLTLKLWVAVSQAVRQCVLMTLCVTTLSTVMAWAFLLVQRALWLPVLLIWLLRVMP